MVNNEKKFNLKSDHKLNRQPSMFNFQTNPNTDNIYNNYANTPKGKFNIQNNVIRPKKEPTQIKENNKYFFF